ncbi:hypothetical protein VNO77_00485 [Canavalia gladiata]|uniref:Uncharacterized protein n=1 Tax=Canavalia gladiata TaxID=3824 RepID=A0AAN9MUS4_CANGL
MRQETSRLGTCCGERARPKMSIWMNESAANQILVSPMSGLKKALLFLPYNALLGIQISKGLVSYSFLSAINHHRLITRVVHRSVICLIVINHDAKIEAHQGR